MQKEITKDRILYREIQNFRHPVIWILISILCLISIFFVLIILNQVKISEGGRISDNPIIFILLVPLILCIILIFMFLNAKLIIELNTEMLSICLYPLALFSEKIMLKNIRICELIDLNPYREYGIGIKQLRGGTAYCVPSEKSVRIELADGRKIIIGSHNACALANAINKVIGEVISKTQAKDIKDMGRVMKEVIKEIAARADGKLVSDLVRQRLSKIQS